MHVRLYRHLVLRTTTRMAAGKCLGFLQIGVYRLSKNSSSKLCTDARSPTHSTSRIHQHLQLCLLLHRPNLQPVLVLLQHVLVVVLIKRSQRIHLHSRTDNSRSTGKNSETGSQHTFQNCLLASLPPTRFKILAPPGCSSTKPAMPYTLPSMMMYSPLSTVLCDATSFAENCSDIFVFYVSKS